MEDMARRFGALLAGVAALAALGSPAVASAQTKLIANVGLNDAFTISLRTESGGSVDGLPPGAYEIEVRDHSQMHNFRLTGPGVNMATTEGFVGTVTWSVNLVDGRYTFQCDPHPSQMRGSFTIGTVSPPPPPPPPPPKPKVQTLTGMIMGSRITLRTAAGRRVTKLRSGRYRIVVHDHSAKHNFHLTGPRVNKRTTARFQGKQTWTVTLRKGRYTFRSDSSRTIRGSFRVT